MKNYFSVAMEEIRKTLGTGGLPIGSDMILDGRMMAPAIIVLSKVNSLRLRSEPSSWSMTLRGVILTMKRGSMMR